MLIRYWITLDHLDKGCPMPRKNPKGDARASNPVALAMNAVHGEDAVEVYYTEAAADPELRARSRERGRVRRAESAVPELRARFHGHAVVLPAEHTVILPDELAKLLEAHAAGQTARTQPCGFNIEYASETRASQARMT